MFYVNHISGKHTHTHIHTTPSQLFVLILVFPKSRELMMENLVVEGNTQFLAFHPLCHPSAITPPPRPAGASDGPQGWDSLEGSGFGV